MEQPEIIKPEHDLAFTKGKGEDAELEANVHEDVSVHKLAEDRKTQEDMERKANKSNK